jgi:uncharacterized protein with von Willebrand factor type A (vWA) domain
MSVHRYSRWDGTQDPLADSALDGRLADAFADRLLGGMSADRAMRRLLERGMPGRFGGLQDMRTRLRRLREDHQQRSHLGDALEDIRQELDEIVALEQTELAAAVDADAIFQQAVLSNLPVDPAGRIGELRSYRFRSAQAQQRFEELMERLRQEMLAAHLGQIAEGMQQMTEQDMTELKHMLADLNRMLERRAAGIEPTQEEFDEFMARHGRFFPERPSNLDELLEGLARRSAAMSRFMASLTPEQRAEMEALAREMMADLDLSFEVSRLGGNLRDLLPDLGWDQPANLEGSRPLGLGEAMSEIEQLSEFEQLEACLRQDYPGASLDDIDSDQVARLLGEDAAADVEDLRRIEQMLQDSGMIARQGGRIELTPRGIRRLGERALATVFERLELDQAGSHEVHEAGGFGEPTGQTRPWRFGDPFRIHLQDTVRNAVLRGGGGGGRVALHPDDFMLTEAESRTSTSTVLLLDMSRSMPMRGHWEHARRMTFALHALISGQYPEDRLHIIGFSDYARELRPADLAAIEWEPVYGTNMEHAFRLAQRRLARDRSTSRQVILVTDGEPTAHLVGEEVFFSWPPEPETIDKTLKEAARLARSGATMNIFMLEQDPRLSRFIDQLARVVRGRVFAIGDDELGAFIVSDYVRGRGR